MDFRRTGSGLVQTGDLEWRYLWGPAVDQILAEENVDNGSDETVQWTLTDHLNTIRDIAKYDSGSDMTTVVNHLIYDAFGRVASESNPAVDSLFHFTARPFDEDTQLQNNLNRWYDAHVGRWLSEDPIGFAGGDGNLYRYCTNNPVVYVDPSGLKCITKRYPSHVWGSHNTGQFGSFVFGLNYIITQKPGTYTVCEICCPDGATGVSVTFDYSAHVDVRGSVEVSWDWNGLLGIGVLNARVYGQIYAQGQGDLNFGGTLRYCAPLMPSGTVKACGESFTLTVGGRITGWANIPGYSLSATIAGAVSIPARFCASVDVGTGTISGAYAEITGPGTGGIRFYGYGKGIGFNKSFDTCLLGNCSGIP
jgi:RHS repeat-associated protein